MAGTVACKEGCVRERMHCAELPLVLRMQEQRDTDGIGGEKERQLFREAVGFEHPGMRWRGRK